MSRTISVFLTGCALMALPLVNHVSASETEEATISSVIQEIVIVVTDSSDSDE